MTDILITQEHLHTAASLAAMMRDFEESGLEQDAVQEFIDDSEFHPPMEAISLAYGILVGVLAVKVKNSERNGDSGD
jgi:hypothetical protein